MYGNGRIPYIDALFFASGAATQSGLNTYVGFWTLGGNELTERRIDINQLDLYQQVRGGIETYKSVTNNL